LDKRKPWFHLFFEAVREFLPQALVGVPKQRRPVSWLQPVFVRHQRTALTGYPSRVAVFGSLPSFQENVSTLNALRRQLACAALSREPLYEKRYPYLDRDLLEFIYAIPRQQVVRPGQRRSLMRRALVGIVPSEILNRKRKAFVARSPMKGIFDEWARWSELTLRLVSSSMGIVEPNFFLDTLKQAREGKEVPTVGLMRTLGVEFWLRELKERGISEGGLSTGILRSRLPQTTAGLTESTAQQELT
jgi:asparagine synthase (glutamine-hydrolysing)